MNISGVTSYYYLDISSIHIMIQICLLSYEMIRKRHFYSNRIFKMITVYNVLAWFTVCHVKLSL